MRKLLSYSNWHSYILVPREQNKVGSGLARRCLSSTQSGLSGEEGLEALTQLPWA